MLLSLLRISLLFMVSSLSFAGGKEEPSGTASARSVESLPVAEDADQEQAEDPVSDQEDDKASSVSSSSLATEDGEVRQNNYKSNIDKSDLAPEEQLFSVGFATCVAITLIGIINNEEKSLYTSLLHYESGGQVALGEFIAAARSANLIEETIGIYVIAGSDRDTFQETIDFLNRSGLGHNIRFKEFNIENGNEFPGLPYGFCVKVDRNGKTFVYLQHEQIYSGHLDDERWVTPEGLAESRARLTESQLEQIQVQHGFQISYNPPSDGFCFWHALAQGLNRLGVVLVISPSE